VFIDRKDKVKAMAAIDEMADKLRHGQSALIFPEGTRQKSGTALQPFKKGGFHMAIKSRAPIQPALLIGSEKIMPPHAYGIRPGRVELRFGRRIDMIPGETVEELMNRTRQEMERLKGQ
jgi:1-acyl-sn-glycerol-3-phosphate acyltransferase